MQAPTQKFTMAAIAIVFSLNAVNAASAGSANGGVWKTTNGGAAMQDPLSKAICCKIGKTHRLMPTAGECRKRRGEIVRKSFCRARKHTSTRSGSGRPPARSATPQPRSNTHTNGGSGKPPAHHSGPAPRGSTSTNSGSGKPPARNHRGYPQTKPNGSLEGCKPRLSVTRYLAATKDGALLTAWITWEEASRNKYGDEFYAKYSKHRTEECSKAGLIWTCKVSALPCPKP